MLIDKANLAVRLAASDDETRINLCALRLEEGCTVATNGHILAAVATSGIDESEFPTVPGLNPVSGDPLTSCSISVAAAQAIEKALPKRARLPILGHACIDNAGANANGHVPVTVTDLENPQHLNPAKVGAEFPDWYQIVPQGEVTFRVAFNADLLADLAAIAKAASGQRKGTPNVLTLEFFEQTECSGAIRVTCSNAPRFAAFLMPCRP